MENLLEDFFAGVVFDEKGRDWRDVSETEFDPDDEDDLRDKVTKSVQKGKE